MDRQVFKYYLQNRHLDWECAFCSLPNFSDSFFDQTGNDSLTEDDSIHNEYSTNVAASLREPNPRDDADNYLQQAALHLNSSTKDLKIAHLNPEQGRRVKIITKHLSLRYNCNYRNPSGQLNF